MLTNELGTGVLSPGVEQSLRARGITFAQRVFRADGSYHLRTCAGDMQKIAAQFIIDNHRLPNYQINNTTALCEAKITL